MIRAITRLPIAVRVPLMAAALMVLVGLIASHQVITTLTRAQEARLAELMRMHVDGLSVALGPLVLRQDVWEVYDTLSRAQDAGEAQRMVLTVVSGKEGRVIAATDPARAPVDSPLWALADPATVTRLDGIALLTGDAHVRVLAPLDYQGREVGQILTELDVSDLAAERSRAVFVLVAFNAAATGGLALLGYVAMRRALLPVAALTGRMTVDGGRPARFTETEVPKGDTEVARLFRSYNKMVDAIEAKAEAERSLAERERLVSLGRLSSSLAHEINNPLGGMLNAADTIETYADRPDIVRSSATLLIRGLRHLRDVAKAALDHNRIERHKTALTAQDLDDLRMLVTPEIRRQDQNLRWTIDVVDADLSSYTAGPIRQVVLNLLLNATGAAGNGGRVSFSAMASDTELRLVVDDDGPGLPEAAWLRLFTSEPATQGGGIGLRVVRDLVAGLGGEIEHQRLDGRTSIVVSLSRIAAVGAA